MTDTPNDGTAGSGPTPPKRPRQGTTSNPRAKRTTSSPQAKRAKVGATKASTPSAAAVPIPTPTPAPDLPAEPPLPAAPGGRRLSRYVPAFLSSIIPGLGQLVMGRRTLAALFLFPVVLLIAGVLVALVVMGPARLAATLIEPEVIWGIIGIQVLFVVWRLLAMATSVLDPAYPKPRARDVVPIGLLILFIVVPQGLVLAVTDQARRTADTVFVGDQATDGAWVPETPAPTFGTPGFDDDPDVLPFGSGASPSPTEGPQRVNVLLIGVDSAPTRNTYLTDTMIVASLDPVAGTVSMVSIPRDMVDVPLPNGRRFAGKINTLVSYARRNPRQFKGANGKGFDVLQGALGTLLGLKIDYYAVVNLPGFVSVIDKLGGINVSVERSFCDPTYTERGYPRGFSIKAGRRHLDGWAALAYARVRKASGESDFSRAARQQEVLSGIRDRLVNGGFLSDPIGLLKSLSRTVSTNVPRKLVPDLVEWAKDVDREDTYREVVSRPMVRGTLELPGRGSIQVPDIKAIRAMADRLFTEPGTLPAARFKAPAAKSGKATSSGVGNCAPARTPRPTPKPTKKPTPKPTAGATPKPTEPPPPTDPPPTDPPPPPDPTP